MSNGAVQAAILLNLAPLPREEVGPFLLLGVAKDATREEIEAAWAQRVIAARKKQIPTPLENVNWAREGLNDSDKRLTADAASLNADTIDRVLKRMEQQQELADFQPLDVEKDLVSYSPPTEVPQVSEIREAVPEAEIPLELPAVAAYLEKLAQSPVGPWNLPISIAEPEVADADNVT